MILNNRKDIVTNKTFNRNELIRISILKDGTTSIDKEYNLGGRGIYIHPSSIEVAIDKGILKKNINRFKGNYESILIQIKEEINNG